ncbi:MAG: DUF4830 domain-containing protein [Oscillospiraceae bacterium]|nr:DUF4830 domain-containing protein [Oscillospiraceae bacterium]
MLVMTAKVDKKKIAMIAGAALVLIVLVALLFGGDDTVPTSAPTTVSGNDDRIQFLASFGWDVASSPTETSQVRIPAEESAVFARYNELQKSQGYDLSPYAGKTVMRYVYKIKNYPGATEPVYATILISNNQVIGGDVTDTAANGTVRSFKMPQSTPGST